MPVTKGDLALRLVTAVIATMEPEQKMLLAGVIDAMAETDDPQEREAMEMARTIMRPYAERD